jgi:hypothetical protein
MQIRLHRRAKLIATLPRMEFQPSQRREKRCAASIPTPDQK